MSQDGNLGFDGDLAKKFRDFSANAMSWGLVDLEDDQVAVGAGPRAIGEVFNELTGQNYNREVEWGKKVKDEARQAQLDEQARMVEDARIKDMAASKNAQGVRNTASARSNPGGARDFSQALGDSDIRDFLGL